MKLPTGQIHYNLPGFILKGTLLDNMTRPELALFFGQYRWPMTFSLAY